MEAKTFDGKNKLNSYSIEVEQQMKFHENDLFVVGCSTSEIIGEKIGTAGALEVRRGFI